jgi:hypothetical protein
MLANLIVSGLSFLLLLIILGAAWRSTPEKRKTAADSPRGANYPDETSSHLRRPKSTNKD